MPLIAVNDLYAKSDIVTDLVMYIKLAYHGFEASLKKYVFLKNTAKPEKNNTIIKIKAYYLFYSGLDNFL